MIEFLRRTNMNQMFSFQDQTDKGRVVIDGRVMRLFMNYDSNTKNDDESTPWTKMAVLIIKAMGSPNLPKLVEKLQDFRELYRKTFEDSDTE